MYWSTRRKGVTLFLKQKILINFTLKYYMRDLQNLKWYTDSFSLLWLFLFLRKLFLTLAIFLTYLSVQFQHVNYPNVCLQIIYLSFAGFRLPISPGWLDLSFKIFNTWFYPSLSCFQSPEHFHWLRFMVCALF